MEKFIVSARKYRPQTFSSVIGQKHITTTLKNAILNNTLAHAFLFCGPRGVGKTTCARILAKTINCENLQPNGEACNQCSSCLSFNNSSSLNIHELDAASNNSVDDIRDLVTQIRFAPQEGKYKIYIIDEVHMLSQAAFNAFLKTLEEPPSYAKFILATTEKHKILPTILSRCQIFDFKRITNADTVEHLQEIASLEKIEAEKAALQLIAQKSEGCMRDALSLLDKIVSFTGGKVTYANTVEHLNLLDEDSFFQLLEALRKQEVGEALLTYDAINARGFEGDIVLNGLAEVIRNLMICKDPKAAKLLDVLEGMEQRYVDMSKSFSMSYLVSALQVLNDAEQNYRIARNRRLHVEMALIKLCYLQQVIDLAVNHEGKVQMKRRTESPVAVREKPISPLLLKTGAASGTRATLTIQQPPDNVAAPLPPQPLPTVPQPVTPPLEPAATPPALVVPATPPTQQGLPKKGNLLETLKREKMASMQKEKEALPVLLPTLEKVQEVWQQYTDRLRQDASRHTTVSSLQMARLQVNGLQVVITSPAKINQKFIEAESSTLLTLIKQTFNNPDITLLFEVNESDEDKNRTIEPKYLSSAERFRLMASEFPAILDLKEKLKLELGY
jgi:DNA polymerase-3 subunit gamma/tau